MSKCEDIRPRLTAFLHGEVENPEEIQSHLDSCAECRKSIETYRKISRLSGLVPDPSPHPEAWVRLKPRLSRFSGSRLFAIIPAAAAAALVLYIFLFSSSSDIRPLGTLARRIGLVRIKPLTGADWLEPGDKQPVYNGHGLKTGADSALRLDLADGGHIMLDEDTEVSLNPPKISSPFRTHFTVLSGRACARNCGRVCFKAGGALLQGCGCQYVVEVDGDRSVIYVRSGSVNCHFGGKQAQVEAMQKLALDSENTLSPEAIENSTVFEWVDGLLP